MGTLIIGETAILGTADGGINDIKANLVTLSHAGVVLSQSIYWSAGAGLARLGIYDAGGSGGLPGNLVAATAEVAPAIGFQTYPVVSPTFMAPGNYWLAFIINNTGTNMRATTVGPGVSDKTFTYGALPGSYGTPTSSGVNWHWSMYATLTDGSILRPEGLSVPIRRNTSY